MPSKEWFEQNPKVSAYLSPKLNSQLKEFMEERGISKVSQALIFVLEEHFGLTPTQAGSPIDTRLAILEKNLKTLQQEVEELQKNKSAVVQSGLLVEPQSKPIVVQSKPLKNKDGLLTTGEAHTEAQRRGYSKSVGTFRRSLKNGVMPTELERIGLEADWGIRNQANPKDNSVKWLKFKLLMDQESH